MTTYDFDDRNIPWQRFDEFDHLHYFILDVDRERPSALPATNLTARAAAVTTW